MNFIKSLEELHGLYGTPGASALRKVAPNLTPEYRAWIVRSRFCILSTVGPEGTDATPRGDTGPVMREIDPQTLALPDWRGNNRLDALRNIVRDPRVSLMFMVPGCDNVVRVNGTAGVTTAPEMIDLFQQNGRTPSSVIVVKIEEIYSQCARAILRAELWSGGDQSSGLPTVGQILAAMTKGEEGGPGYDAEWSGRAAKTMW